MLPPPPRSTLFPYTTLFRSRVVLHLRPSLAPVKAAVLPLLRNRPELVELARRLAAELRAVLPAMYDDTRSEEHTSELQSHSDLVCRLLLEKKKKKINRSTQS